MEIASSKPSDRIVAAFALEEGGAFGRGFDLGRVEK
jgi:hypothetical protein